MSDEAVQIAHAQMLDAEAELDEVQARLDRAEEALTKAHAVPDNNIYGQASDPGSVLRETREIIASYFATERGATPEGNSDE